MTREKSILSIMALLVPVFFLLNLGWGAVSIPLKETFSIISGNEASRESWTYIILESRLPQAITALLAGASLSISGLILQTVFNNPLASPAILGINNGASLGTAIVMLATGGSIGGAFSGMSDYVSIMAGAFAGAMAVLAVIILFSSIVKSNIMLLIIGLMVGYMTSSVISLLNFFASAEGVFAYTMWGMGDFSSVSMKQIPVFASVTLCGLAASLLMMKPMNALLLGERYAENIGVNIRRTRIMLFAITGLLTGITTAFCGPIAFIGLSVPHIARLLLRSSNHAMLIPASILAGSITALLCNACCTFPGISTIMPLNAITPIIGAPVILYVIINQKKIQYFN